MRMRKRLGYIVMAFMLIGCHVFEAKAAESSFTGLDVREDTSEYDEINEYLVEHGREVLENQKRRNVNAQVKLGNIVRLRQDDVRWKDEVMETRKLTIGSAGCCLTSFTIMKNRLSGTTDTPSDVNSKMGEYACDFNWIQAESLYGYTILTKVSKETGITNERAKLNIVGAIDEYSQPAIVGLKKSDNSTHFVVAYGYDSDGEIVICDPAGRNYTKISQYYDAGYFVHRLYVYAQE